MGLTFACAKCHSHKFDPITQTDYYRIMAIFNQSEDADRNDEAPTLTVPSAFVFPASAKVDSSVP